ncbi:MAG: tetraacyldisaccharide 4'-kinase [Desulfobacula sp.]|uniref:tetraacyldisaccharide 4'-kinase n=1 Tax=Desulfobacula sp. TaxID=2593537 RepID=UPI001D1DD4F9|nr:tetraacyldisaccharide 4'-kinase [Desulfobacula sp.]MBT3484489.1 tetraacyldisaccharide 4'-kinase [Desulfobacula sp.]MBT3803127.1 tetraacyldisaccharide 4'-kinase [Desulfobacula sp.]MBT4024697.1 tetraacyldisaccharide 4'-kinase [Desulfobacula sp.]MBT4197175.1 tetraacyldisaccharide 4'-kinase [Desulfobacula sp.]
MFEKHLNKLEKRITQISESHYKPGIFSFEWFAIAISNVYGLGVRFRLWLYNKGILKQRALPCFVISVGNIVVGGTGKTPMAIYLAQVLKKMGKQPVVVSRGYKGCYKGDAGIVSDGDKIFLSAKDSGDEPYMMAKRRAFPIVIGKDRFKAGMRAINAFKPDVIVLDDGFQHLKLKRDLDFLLLDYLSPLGNKRFLPAGRLRESPLTCAQRTDALIFTRCLDIDENTESIDEVLKYYTDRPEFKTFHRPFILKHIVKGTNLKTSQNDVGGLKGKKAVLFSGIAKNFSFYNTMKELGINILDHLEFKDHYRYKDSDILMINKLAKKVCADLVLTTEKDWAKLDKDSKWGLDLIVMGIQIEFEHPQKFESFLSSRLQKNE